MEPTTSVEEQVRALREGAGVAALDELAVIAARGADRRAWLNGVVTQDVRSLSAGASAFAAALGPKGKILTDLHVLAREDELLLVLPAAQREAVLAHLDRYVVMEDVTLEASSESVITAQGPGAKGAMEAMGEVFEVDRLGRGGVDLLCAPGRRAAVEAAVVDLARAGRVTVVGPEAWEVARVSAGVPAFGRDYDASNFVQEAVITPRAVSFQKGCYLGQEVVCRLEMRGQVQRHLARFTVEGVAPAPGTAVLREGVPVGSVTSSAPAATGGGRSAFIAMVKRAALEAGGGFEVDGRVAALEATAA